MKVVSALDNKVVQERAAELKKRSERNAEATRLRDEARMKARGAAEAMKAEAMAKTESANALAPASKVPAAESANPEPAVVVQTSRSAEEAPVILAGVQIREIDPATAQESKYQPEELQAKARALLDMNVLPPDQRKVLEEIITKQEIAARRK